MPRKTSKASFITNPLKKPEFNYESQGLSIVEILQYRSNVPINICKNNKAPHQLSSNPINHKPIKTDLPDLLTIKHLREYLPKETN